MTQNGTIDAQAACELLCCESVFLAQLVAAGEVSAAGDSWLNFNISKKDVERYNASRENGPKMNWEQASDVVNCGKSHFYNLIGSGRIPYSRHGLVRGVWVWQKDVLVYVASRRGANEDRLGQLLLMLPR